MASNPYEAPRADIAGAPAKAPAPAAASLNPEVERRAFELFGQKRSRLTGISLAVSGIVCIGFMALLTGLLPGLIFGGALAGAISKGFVRSQTSRLAAAVCDELGIARGSFNPERFLI